MSDVTIPGDQAGDERATLFVGLLARYQTSIFRYIYALVANWADAEDLWQTTSVVLWQKFDQFEPDSDFLSWACTVARFQVSHFRRKMGRDRLVFSDELQELLAAESLVQEDRLTAERRALSNCLKKLPRRERELLSSRYVVGANLKRLAEEQGQSPNSVYKFLQRIRAELLACIERTLAREV